MSEEINIVQGIVPKSVLDTTLRKTLVSLRIEFWRAITR